MDVKSNGFTLNVLRFIQFQKESGIAQTAGSYLSARGTKLIKNVNINHYMYIVVKI